MKGEIILYDTGFMGYETQQTVVEQGQVNIDKVISNIKLNKKTTSTTKTKVYNQEVMELVKRYETNTKQAGDIHFVCDLIECALRAFDCKLINSWLSLQLKNNQLSDMHIRFLEDTWQFIATGNRSINIMSWARMLDGSNSSSSQSTKKLEIVKLLGGSQFNQVSAQSVKTSAILIRWVSQPNGIEDLVYSLPVLFGKV